MPVRVGSEVQALPRRLAPLAWITLGVLAVVGLAMLGRGGVAESPPEPAASPSPPLAGGEWTELPPAPVSTPGEHRGVWTGSELIVGGGQNDLAAYDPGAGEWRDLPPTLIEFGHDPELTWTGSELLVWGGHLVEGRQVELAALDPRTDTWRRGADLHGRLASLVVHVWAGDRLLVWDRTRGSAYDPAADEWTDSARIPLGWAAAAALWTGQEVLVWGTRMAASDVPFAAAYDPDSDTWRQLRRPWMVNPERAAAVWMDDELLLWGRPRLVDGEDGPPAGFVYAPATDGWRWLPAAPVDARPEELYGFQAAWTGRQALIYGGHPTRIALAYDGAWRELPPGGGSRLDAVLAWTGSELLVWGGYTAHGPTTGLVAWRP